MSELLLKQVGSGDTATSVVPAGAKIVHNRIENRLDVIGVGELTIVSFDLGEGVVYLMNGAGKTIDKYDSNGAPPKQSSERELAIPTDEVISIGGVRYININGKTFRIPEDNPSLTLEAYDENNVTLTHTTLNKWKVLKNYQTLRDLFGVYGPQVHHVKVVGALELMPFNLGVGVTFKGGTEVPHETQIKEFGVGFRLTNNVHVVKNNKVYIAGSNDNLLYCGLLVEGK